MSATQWTEPVPAVDRDRYGRPLVTPPGGGKATPYTRCTTFVGCLEDTYNLSRWQQRMVALGLSERPDLMLAVTATDRSDKQALGGICDSAMEAAKAHAAATTGTALHALTERVDRGQEVGIVPDAYVADLAAYATATTDLRHELIEQFCVLDPLKVGGTPDRVVKYQGTRYIADLKTGSIAYGIGKIAMQLAVYARSQVYDISTGERSMHDADLTRGIIIHLPAGTGECTLHWVDLVQGWYGVQMARAVRDWRKLKLGDLTETFGAAATEPPTLAQQVSACTTAQAVRDLWATHASEWTDALTQTAKEHIGSLGTNGSNAA
ncbi:MAG: hypothetical protein ACRDQA_07925 [Nocardioidaceae bacterium]